LKRRTLISALALLSLPVAAAVAQRDTNRVGGGGEQRSDGPSQRDWTETAERTPEGGFRIGNPNARVKVIEYLSLSCSHCAQFAADSSSSLWSDYVRRGTVNVEYRNFVLNGFDMAAAMLSRCAAPRRYFDMTHYLLGHQPDWLGRSQALTEAQRNELRGATPLQAMERLVPLLGLDRVARQHGLSAAQVQACVADQANLDQVAALQQVGGSLGVTGTPTFFINGQRLDVNDWAGVQQRLRAAVDG